MSSVIHYSKLLNLRRACGYPWFVTKSDRSMGIHYLRLVSEVGDSLMGLSLWLVASVIPQDRQCQNLIKLWGTQLVSAEKWRILGVEHTHICVRSVVINSFVTWGSKYLRDWHLPGDPLKSISLHLDPSLLLNSFIQSGYKIDIWLHKNFPHHFTIQACHLTEITVFKTRNQIFRE